MIARITAAFADNPVLEKDVLTQLRAPRFLGGVTAAIVASFLVVAAMFAALEPSAAEIAQWGQFHTAGRALFAMLVGGAIALASLIVPAVGAAGIAAERERGTLPLITATALSPSRIVAGKLGALLVSLAPVFIPLFALLPLAHVYGDVSLLVLALGLVVVAWHVACASAIAVGASAASAKLRGAAPLAIVAVAVVSFAGALPVVVACGLYVDHSGADLLAPLVISGVYLETVLAAAALSWAKSALSFRAERRWPARRVILALLLAGFPVVCALAALAVPTRHDADAFVALLHVEVILVVLVGIVAEVVNADRHTADARSPLGQAWLAVALAALGIGVAWLLPAPAAVRPSDDFVWQLPALGVGVVVGYLAVLATLAAAVSCAVQRVPLRVTIVVALAAAHAIVPAILHEARHLVPLGALDFAWTHPIYILDHGNALVGIAYYAAAAAALSLLARSRAAR